MIHKSSILFGLAAVPAAVSAASFQPRAAAKDSGFLSFPIQRGENTRTLTGRQATASLTNEQETSYLIECKSFPSSRQRHPTNFAFAVTFGSNSQAVKVAIDTGSDELFVDPNCNDKDFSSSVQSECAADGVYDPSSSTSSKSTGETSQIVYGSGAVDLAYYIDSIGIPGSSSNLSSVQFGVATASDDLNEGILGIGFGKDVNLNYSNFIDALQEQGVTKTKAFSVALGESSTAGGTIIFGGVDTKKFSGSLASLDIESPATGDIQRYAVAVSSISFTNSSGTQEFSDSSLTGVVLDTGSSLCELPSAVVQSMMDVLGGQEDTESGLIIVDCDLMTSSNTIDFAFDGVTIKAPMSSFMLQDGESCVLGAQALPANSGITALLGDSFLRSAYVVFDQTNMKISLAQYTNCGTNEQAITTGSSGAADFTGECSSGSSSSGSSSSSSSSSSKSGAELGQQQPAARTVWALVAGLATLMTLF